MNFLSWLDSIAPSDRPLVGEKAYILAQLKQRGYPVVSGFVITSNAFTAFLDLLDDPESLLADFPHSSLHLDVDDPAALQLVAQKSRSFILQTPLPSTRLTELVEAVQCLQAFSLIWQLSFGLTSSCGQLFSDTLSWTDPQSLEIALKTTWSELFRAKSLFFWQRQGIPLEKVRLAVVAQPLTDALTSGQVLVDSENLQIQATRGLIWSLHQGENQPDTYTVQRANSQLQSQQIGSKTKIYRRHSRVNSEDYFSVTWFDGVESYCLNEARIQGLTALTERLLEDYPRLQRFEWLVAPEEPEKIYITDLTEAPVEAEPASPTILLKGVGVAGGMALAPVHIFQSKETIARNHILVAPRIEPDWLPWLKTARGLIIEQGSDTSHGAIIAREFGIPAVVANQATQILKNGDLVQLDGNTGLIYAASPQQLPLFPPPPRHFPPDSTSVFAYPIATQLMVNLSQGDALAALAQLPVDGVGLLRSEWLLLDLLQIQPLRDWLHPSQIDYLIEQLAQRISQFTQAFHPRPVFYRSLDGNQGEVISSVQGLLGERGTYNYFLDPSLFDLELQVLKQVQETANGNINLILPFVRSVEEFNFCRQRVEKLGLNQYPEFKLLIMAEVPSVIFLLPHYVKAGVQGIAIGTNDLSQLLLGIDRENTMLSKQFNVLHPAFLNALKQLIQQSRILGIPCSICGQAPVQHPELIDNLIDWGITSISVEPDAVASTYRAIARAEQRLYLTSVQGREI